MVPLAQGWIVLQRIHDHVADQCQKWYITQCICIFMLLIHAYTIRKIFSMFLVSSEKRSIPNLCPRLKNSESFDLCAGHVCVCVTSAQT